MRGLIIKDLLSLKNNWKQTLILFIGCLLIGISINNYLLCILFVPIIITSSGITTFSTDEFFNTESYTLAMPISRKKIVLAKYIFTFITLILSIYLGALIYAILDLVINPDYNALNGFMVYEMLIFECVAMITNFVFYPVIYKFGCEKSKLVLLAIVILFLGVFSIMSTFFPLVNASNIDYEGIYNWAVNNGLIVVTIITVIITFISYKLSVLFFKKKDY